MQNAEVVHVAPPTGQHVADRASIVAALEPVRPDGTVQFAPGTYLLGGFIPVSVSGVTLLGHPNGTTLRGCDPAGRSTPDSRVRCNTLALIGSRQVVRNLTFEYMSCDSYNGVRAAGDWPEPGYAARGPGELPAGVEPVSGVDRRAEIERLQTGPGENSSEGEPKS